MSRTAIPFSVPDISALARILREQLDGCDHPPSHVEWLNLLARSAGFRNFQSLRAHAAAHNLLGPPQPEPEPVDFAQVKRLAGYFDKTGCLSSWPAKTSLQVPCLWVLWSKLPPREAFTEVQLNTRLRALHGFGDHALLRRELCDRGLLARTPDGREYRRVERRPPIEARALIQHLAGGAR